MHKLIFCIILKAALISHIYMITVFLKSCFLFASDGRPWSVNC